MYTFSHSYPGETPIYSEENEAGRVVLYLKATSPSAANNPSTITICSVDNSVECKPKDHKICTKDENNPSGNIYWVDSCNDKESRPIEICGKRGCYIPTASCLEEVTPKEEPIEIPDKYKANETLKQEVFKCNGCELNSKCYPYGFRKNRDYCSDKDNQFISQIESNNVCQNNFECQSNVCVAGKCVSENLLQKILNWFKRLFSG